MKKKIFILLLLLLLTGCKANYNLQFNFGGSVIESGKVYFDSSLKGKNGYSTNTDDFLAQILKDNNASNYKTKIKFESGNYVGYSFYHRYRGINYYNGNSPLLKSLYGYLNVTNTDGYVKIEANNSNLANYNNPTSDNPTRVESIELTISLPYKVIKNNATRVNASKNEYTWYLTPGGNDYINLEYRTTSLYSNNPLDLMRFVNIYIYIFIVLLIVAISFGVYFRNRAMMRDKF